MSVTMLFGDDQISEQVATNRGWVDFLDWITDDEDDEMLERCPVLLALAEHHECTDLAGLTKEIDELVKSGDVEDETIKSTLIGIAGFAKKYKAERYAIIGERSIDEYDEDGNPIETDDDDDD